MTSMHFIFASSEEFGQQLFGFPSTIDPEQMVKVIGYIRHGGPRNWRRVKRTLVRSGVIGESMANAEFFASEMKYIVTESDETGKQMFIFPKKIDHDSMSEILSEIEESIGGEKPDNFYRGPVSAGFIDGKACYGKSETLGIASDKLDTALFKSGGHSPKQSAN